MDGLQNRQACAAPTNLDDLEQVVYSEEQLKLELQNLSHHDPYFVKCELEKYEAAQAAAHAQAAAQAAAAHAANMHAAAMNMHAMNMHMQKPA